MKTKPANVFVDAILGHTARLMFGQITFDMPAQLLPRDAREGSWLRLLVEIIPPPPDGTDDLRRKLGKADPGGDIKL